MNSRCHYSICICTYNRASRLQRALESMLKMQSPPTRDWELLIVDNNSKDQTKKVAHRFLDHLPLRYIFEPAQGLSYARNRALRECRGDLLIFTDDDVTVEKGWFRALASAAEQFEQKDYFGGRIFVDWQGKRPHWLRDEKMSLLAGLMVRYDLGADVRPYRKDDLGPYGANFAIRRRLFREIRPFRTDLGVRGDLVGRGEELEYIQRAQAKGFSGVYVGNALCHHYADLRRFRLAHLYRYGVEKGLAHRRIYSADPVRKGTRTKQLSFLLRGLFQISRGRRDRFRQCVINMGIQQGLRRKMT